LVAGHPGRPSSSAQSTRPTSAQPRESLEQALTSALSNDNDRQLFGMLAVLTPDVVFGEVSQPVVLSLIHRLAASLDETFQPRIGWIHEAMNALDPSDGLIAPHVPAILVTCRENLEHYVSTHRLDKQTRAMIRDIVQMIDSTPLIKS
jgi:hypothetical protein